jgi:hypothetical protein
MGLRGIWIGFESGGGSFAVAPHKYIDSVFEGIILLCKSCGVMHLVSLHVPTNLQWIYHIFSTSLSPLSFVFVFPLILYYYQLHHSSNHNKST